MVLVMDYSPVMCFIDSWLVVIERCQIQECFSINSIISYGIYRKERYSSENFYTIFIPWDTHLFEHMNPAKYSNMFFTWFSHIRTRNSLMRKFNWFHKSFFNKKINAIYWRRAQNKMISVFNNWTNNLIIFIIYHIQNEIFLRIIRWGERSNTKNFSNIFQIVSFFYSVCLFVRLFCFLATITDSTLHLHVSVFVVFFCLSLSFCFDSLFSIWILNVSHAHAYFPMRRLNIKSK